MATHLVGEALITSNQSARAFAKILDQVNTVDIRDLRGGPSQRRAEWCASTAVAQALEGLLFVGDLS